MKLDIVKVMEQNESTKVIDEKVIAIERALEKLHNLYRALTYEICGETYDVFDNRILNYKEVLELEGLHFVVKEHGFGKAFFLTYKKPTFLWFSKEKQFYFSQGYSFHVEYKRENRYDFTLEDYSFILDTLNRENEKLQQYIIKVRDFKSSKVS